MITSSDVSSSFILKNGTKWELLLSPFTGEEKWRKWELSEIPGRIWVKTCAFLMLTCYLQSRPVLCLLILSHTPNTTQLLRKRIRVTPRGWLAWAWAHLRSLPLHPSSAPTRLQMVSPPPPSGEGFLALHQKGSFPPRAAPANTSATWSDQAGLGSHGELHIPPLGHRRCALSCGLWKKKIYPNLSDEIHLVLLLNMAFLFKILSRFLFLSTDLRHRTSIFQPNHYFLKVTNIHEIEKRHSKWWDFKVWIFVLSSGDISSPSRCTPWLWISLLDSPFD